LNLPKTGLKRIIFSPQNDEGRDHLPASRNDKGAALDKESQVLVPLFPAGQSSGT